MKPLAGAVYCEIDGLSGGSRDSSCSLVRASSAAFLCASSKALACTETSGPYVMHRSRHSFKTCKRKILSASEPWLAPSP